MLYKKICFSLSFLVSWRFTIYTPPPLEGSIIFDKVWFRTWSGSTVPFTRPSCYFGKPKWYNAFLWSLPLRDIWTQLRNRNPLVLTRDTRLAQWFLADASSLGWLGAYWPAFLVLHEGTRKASAGKANIAGDCRTWTRPLFFCWSFSSCTCRAFASLLFKGGGFESTIVRALLLRNILTDSFCEIFDRVYHGTKGFLSSPAASSDILGSARVYYLFAANISQNDT